MFELTQNKFLSNICKYADEYENTVFVRREENGFTAKLRFKDKDIQLAPVKICVPPKEGEENGIDTSISYPAEKKDMLNEDFYIDGMDGFKDLIQHWINLLNDIRFMNIPNEYLINIKENKEAGATIEDAEYTKFVRLNEYEELTPYINAIFHKEGEETSSPQITCIPRM